MIKQGDEVYCEIKKDYKGLVLLVLMNIFAEKGVIIKLKKTRKDSDKIAVTDTSDFISEKILFNLMGEKISIKKIMPVEDKIIRPLYLFLDKEVLLYARLKSLKYESTEKKKDKISGFIDNLEKKHPEVKHSVVNYFLELQR